MGHRPATVLQEGAKKKKKHHFIPNCPRCHSNASLAFKHVSPLTTDQDFHSPQSVWFSPACSNWFMDSMVDHKTRTLIAKVVAKGFSVRRVKVTGFDKDYYNNQQGCSLYYYICFKQHNPLPFRKKNVYNWSYFPFTSYSNKYQMGLWMKYTSCYMQVKGMKCDDNIEIWSVVYYRSTLYHIMKITTDILQALYKWKSNTLLSCVQWNEFHSSAMTAVRKVNIRGWHMKRLIRTNPLQCKWNTHSITVWD